MVEQARPFFFKLFATILIFCFCHILLELSNKMIAETEKIRFKKSVEDTKEVIFDLPGQMNGDHFKRTKRVNVSGKRFVASHEWQEINSDHRVIPSGLHYRINLETGKKEAKLLTENGNKSKESLIINEYNVQQHKNSITNQLNNDLNDQLNKSLDKNFFKLNSGPEFEKLQKEFGQIEFDGKNTKVNKNKNFENWKSIDQLKKEFKDLNIKLSTDTENVNQLLNQYQKATNEEQKIAILKDLEYVLHQYDVSGDFIKIDGLEILKNDLLNNKNDEIQCLISLTLGSASSANPPVKIAIIQSGVFDILITKLNVEKDLKILKMNLFAISQIIRQFPYAQQVFFKRNGLGTLKKFFDKNNLNLKNYNSINLTKVQTKIISLLGDLLDEYNFTLDQLNVFENITNQLDSKEHNILKEKIKQYNEANFKQNVIKEEFCPIICVNLNNDSYDIKEKVIKSMYSFREICKTDFKKYLGTLTIIKQELEDKIKKDDLDDYFQNLSKSIQNLIDFLTN